LITAIIIGASIVLAGVFVWAWAFQPGFRRQIEYPKHSFQEQVQAYDQHCELADERLEAGIDESG
jgi:hypothetical protein